MTTHHSTHGARLRAGGWMLVIAALLLPSVVHAQVVWQGRVGAETNDQATQADAFLPNELWIMEGDSVTWKFGPQNEIHTLTLLEPGQVRLPFNVGCPGTTSSGSSFDGTACVNSGPLANGATYTVKFPAAGNYKFVCLVHTDMNGVVHVLSTAPPHDQTFYDDLAANEERALLSDKDHSSDDEPFRSNTTVTAGTGEVVATGGGLQYRTIVRFLNGTVHIRVGETVEWTNTDPTEPHTVTFGTEPPNPMTQMNVTTDADGALHGTINSPSDSVSSGFIAAQLPDRIGSSQLEPGTTRIRITFTHEGAYDYICALHDVDGMVGKVVVHK